MIALMMVLLGTMAVTALLYVMGARLQQSERIASAVQRRLSWQNTGSVNRQYVYVHALRDGGTRSTSTASLASNWGGLQAAPFSSLSAFETSQRPSDQLHTYPFNNVRVPPTDDGGYFYERTTADSNTNQAESVSFFNYLKTYPAPLQGDLLVIHKRASGASGDYYITDNLRVDGRVVIYDGTAQTEVVRADSYIHMNPGFTNRMKNNAGTADILPENYNAIPTATAGYGGSGTPTAVTNGTLNLINNTNFTPGSLYHLGEEFGDWETFSSTKKSGNSNSEVEIAEETKPEYPPPTASPYGYSYSGKLNVITIRLGKSSLEHVRITGSYHQIILEGQTTSSTYASAASLPPVIVWVDQNSVRDIRFEGENSRRFILALGKGNGATVHLGFEDSSIVSGGPLRWRMQMICEYRPVYFNFSSGANLQITGGIRTDWTLNCTDGGATPRILIQRETDPGPLETLLPRDGWLETYTLIR
jgi:hypothetical protein